MSDMERRDDELEIEGHAYPKAGLNEEPAEDGEDEVEAHVQRVANVRMDSPSNT